MASVIKGAKYVLVVGVRMFRSSGKEFVIAVSAALFWSMANRIKAKRPFARSGGQNHVPLVFRAQIRGVVIWLETKTKAMGKNFLESDIFYRRVSCKVMVFSSLCVV